MIIDANRRTLKLSKDVRNLQDIGDGIHIYQWSPRSCDPNCVLAGTNPPTSLEDHSQLWAPFVNSISLNVLEDASPGQASQDATTQLVAYLWDWNEYQDAKAAGVPLKTAFEASGCRQFLAGWWAGTIGVREVYATNFGEGYEVPRQIMPNDQCSAFQNWWVLVLDWIYDTASQSVEVIVDQKNIVEGF